jgi:fatty acid desaturase
VSAPEAPAPDWLREAIAAGDAFHIRRQRPAVHNAKNLALFLALVAGVALTVRASAWLPPGTYLAVASPMFAWLIFSSFVLVVHEAAHNMFVVTGDRAATRRLNRAFGWLCAAPIGMDYGQHWEKGHIAHHSRPCEPVDPQNCSVLVGRALLKEILLILVPGYIVWRGRKGVGVSYACPAVAAYERNVPLTLFKVVFWAALVAASVITGRWAIPVAIILGLQLASVLQLVKIAFEHGGELGRDPNTLLRSRSTDLPLRGLLLPFNISLHFQHHLSPRVPWYELPRYGRKLLEIVPPEERGRIFARGSLSLLRGE